MSFLYRLDRKLPAEYIRLIVYCKKHNIPYRRAYSRTVVQGKVPYKRFNSSTVCVRADTLPALFNQPDLYHVMTVKRALAKYSQT